MWCIIPKEVSRRDVTIIGLCATIAGLVAYVVKISISYGKTQSQLSDVIKMSTQLKEENSTIKDKVSILEIVVENNSKRDEEERLKSCKKFDDLYASKNKTNEVITELTTTIKLMMNNFDSQFRNLDKKIDELRRG